MSSRLHGAQIRGRGRKASAPDRVLNGLRAAFRSAIWTELS